jgi:hypothetical protein
MDNSISILNIGLPIGIAFFILSVISYFVIRSTSDNTILLLIMLLASISVMCLVVDSSIHYYAQGSLGFTWSIIVNAITIPVIAILVTIKKGKELNLIISKKLHR